MKLLSTGSHSPYFENRKLVRGCTPEASPWLETGYCEPGVVNRKLFRSWKPDIVNWKLLHSWKLDIVNRS